MRRGRQWLSRFVWVTGSFLLSLSLLVGLGVLIGKLVIDQQLAKYGVSEWSIQLARVSSHQIVFEKISFTLTQRPGTSIEPTTSSPVTLTKLLKTPLPTWLPDSITVNQLLIKGSALAPYSPVQATVLFTKVPQQLEIHLQTPESIDLVATRSRSGVHVTANHPMGNASLDYRLPQGQLSIEAKGDPPTITFATPSTPVSVKTDTVGLSIEGSLSPSVAINDPKQVIDDLTAQAALSLPTNSKILSDAVDTTLSGNIQLRLRNGVIQNYALFAQGDATRWPELPVALGQITWQLSSEDSLHTPVMDYQSLLDKKHWPLELAAQLNGQAADNIALNARGDLLFHHGEFQQLQLPELNISADGLNLTADDIPVSPVTVSSVDFSGKLIATSHQLQMKSTGESAASLSTPYGQFSLSMQHVSARVPMAAPENADVTAALQLRDVKELPQPLNHMSPELNARLQYESGALSATGDIGLTKTLQAEYQARLSPELQLSSKLTLNAQATAESDPSQQTLNRLVQHAAPLLTIQRINGTASAEVRADLSSGSWRIDNGHLDLNKFDFIYDTLAVADVHLDADFQVNKAQLEISSGNLGIDHLQQGFRSGPLAAQFTAEIPLTAPAKSRFTLGEHRLEAFGGRIMLPEQTYSLSQSIHMPVVLEYIKLDALMRQYPTNKIAIDGSVSGTIPLYWDSQQLTVNNGYFNAVAPGGHLQLNPSALSSAIGNNPSLNVLASGLENFYYDELSSVIDYDDNGKLMLELTLRGHNPDFQDGRTINLNLSIDEDLPALIKGLQLSSGVSDAIRKRIQKQVN